MIFETPDDLRKITWDELRSSVKEASYRDQLIINNPEELMKLCSGPIQLIFNDLSDIVLNSLIYSCPRDLKLATYQNRSTVRGLEIYEIFTRLPHLPSI